jgi:hypothetical protein
MQTIIKLFFIAAVLFLAYTIATADGPLVNVTTDSTQPPAPQVIFIPAPVTAPEPAQTAVISPPPAAPAAQPTALVGETIYDDAIITTAKVVQACMADAAAKAAAAQHPPDCSKIVLQLRDLQERRETLLGVGR